MLIGELSSKAGISKDTIRFYEKRGLLFSNKNSENNYRDFSEEAINLIQFINNLKELGFTLEEIKDFIEIINDESNDCISVKRKFEKQLEKIDNKIKIFTEIRKKIVASIEKCNSYPDSKSCNTLKNLWV